LPEKADTGRKISSLLLGTCQKAGTLARLGNECTGKVIVYPAGTGTASTTLELQRDGISWNIYDLIIYLIGVFRVPESLFHPLPTARSGRTG